MFFLSIFASLFQFVILGKDPSIKIMNHILKRPKTVAMMDELVPIHSTRQWILIYSFKVIRTRIRMSLVIAGLVIWNLTLLFS